MGDVTIRELIGFEQIRTIYQLTRQNSTLSEAVFEDRMRQMLAQGNYRCIAAYRGERLVAASGFWIGMQLWSGRYCEPDHVIVDASERGQGIGAELMLWIEQEAERLGCDVLRVAILDRKGVRNFYRQNGFADDGLVLVKTLSAWAEQEFPEYAAHKAATRSS